MTHYHTLSTNEAFRQLETSPDGLSSEEARRRVEQYGPNKLPQGKRETLWQIILHQVASPFIFILLAAAIASLLIGEASDAAFIFLIITINSVLGAYQEYQAGKSASALQQLVRIRTLVLRNGERRVIDSEELVPGDIVLLESGVKIPADLLLMQTTDLEVDESVLTGESLPVVKRPGILPENIDVSDRVNMLFAGTTVIAGRGRGLVVRTGVYTEIGSIARNVAEEISAKPPLILRMEKFTRQITIFIIVVSVLLAVAMRLRGMEMSNVFFLVVALAVSAIPEGLPVALTVALSIATQRMAKRNVIVRRLNAVESLGSCTVIASDKTGTLTVNEQTVKKILLPDGSAFSVTGEGYNGNGQITGDENHSMIQQSHHHSCLQTIVRVSTLANEGGLKRNPEGWEHHGDSMEVALLGMVMKFNEVPEELRKQHRVTGVIPYESELKFSAAFYHRDDKIYAGIKGAVETVLEFCDRMAYDQSEQPLNREALTQMADAMAAQGYRVLAFAEGVTEHFTEKSHYNAGDLPSMVFYGLVCFIDPLRAEAKISVERCRVAGIRILMITGDHPATAATLSRELGILYVNTPVVTGKMLSDAGDPNGIAFEEVVISTTVFARVTPVQKLQIVETLIRRGEFVAVTGDGVNDAPALKRANIGVAMGSGTDVAKEVGTMIVVDDNFSSIVAGVEEGRYAYDNVRKVIYMLVSTGAAEVMLFILALIFGVPLPLLAVQLLWLNLVTNGIQDVSLAFEGGEPGAMLKKPRHPSEPIFNRPMNRSILVSAVTIGGIVFALWYYLIQVVGMNELHARDMTLLLMVFMQNFHTFNSRSETVSVFNIPLKRNVILVFGVLAAQGIHILAMHIPFLQKLLHIEPITLNEWLTVLLLAIPILLVMEVYKMVVRRHYA